MEVHAENGKRVSRFYSSVYFCDKTSDIICHYRKHSVTVAEVKKSHKVNKLSLFIS